MPLTRKHIRSLQVARGLTFEEITSRSGIAPQAIIALLNDQDKDPSKLISQSTLQRVFNLLGIASLSEGLRANAVLAWKHPKQGDRATWLSAIQHLRKELFGTVDMAIIYKRTGWLERKSAFALIHDPAAGLKVAITGLDSSAVKFVKTCFQPDSFKELALKATEFDSSSKQIDFGVFRPAQFNILVGGKVVKYSWEDVQVAAKEFNFTTDRLIDLMVGTVTEVVVEAEPAAEDAIVARFPHLPVKQVG